MTNLNISGWGYSKWGNARFGYRRTGVYAALAIADDALKAMLEQTAPGVISCYPIITVDGADISDETFYVRLSLRVNGSSDAELKMTDDAETVTAKTSIIAVSVRYVTASGAVYEVERFRGKAETVEIQYEDSMTVRRVVCYDLGYALQLVPPSLGVIQSGQYAGSYTWIEDTITGALNSELAARGYAPFCGIIAEDGETRFFTPNRRGKSREWLNALAGMLAKAGTYFGPSEVLRAQRYAADAVSAWAFPLTCQTKQESTQDQTNRLNCVLVTGSEEGKVTINGVQYPYTAIDAADVAARGLLYKSVWVPEFYRSTGELTGTIDTAACLAHAQALIAWSVLSERTWTTPLHAYVHPLDVVTLSLREGGTAEVMVEEVTDIMGSTTGRFDGCWSNWKGRVLP